MKPCKGKHGTCPNLVEYNETYCASCIPHEAERNKAKNREYEKERARKEPQIRAFYQSAAWRKLRRYKLKVNPICQCEKCQAGVLKLTPANTAHHIVPVGVNWALRLKMSNLLSMSRECHERHHGRKR